MNDLISRQAAIVALIRKKGPINNGDGTMTVTPLTDTVIKDVLENLPSAQQWILCSERLPEDDTEVIVSCTDDSGDSEFSYTTTGWHFKGMWVVGNERSYFVRAWMPLPKPHEVEE